MVASFEDGKDAGALRTIGELGEALAIKPHVLRYWEAQFPQLQPMKRSGGRRYYRPDDVALVIEIDRLVNREGYTLRGAKAALKDFKAGPVTLAPEAFAAAAPGDAALPFAPPPAPTESRAIERDALARLRAIRQTLADALEA